MYLSRKIYKNKSLTHHSDGGLQYCSNEYQKQLNKNNIKTSVTEKYAPYENAIAERVNGILIQEFDIARDIGNLDNKKHLNKTQLISITIKDLIYQIKY